MVGGVDGAPRDPEYVEALGRAVYNFAYLEWAIVNIIERLEPGYPQEIRSSKGPPDKLLHAKPMAAPDGALQLRYQARDIAWDLDTVLKAATKFSEAANAAVHLYYEALSK